MSKKALFITVKDLKDKSIINGNTDADKLIQHIEVAQDIHIHQYLGSRLYEKLQSLIIAGTIDDVANADYKTLRDSYIKPSLVWFAQAEYMPFSAFSIDNGGLNRRRTQDEDIIDFDDIDKLTNLCRKNADFYTQRLVDYLCANSEKYPEYLNNQDEDLRPNRDNNNFSSIVI